MKSNSKSKILLKLAERNYTQDDLTRIIPLARYNKLEIK
jgi:hypothetical protein